MYYLPPPPQLFTSKAKASLITIFKYLWLISYNKTLINHLLLASSINETLYSCTGLTGTYVNHVSRGAVFPQCLFLLFGTGKMTPGGTYKIH